MFQPGEVIEFSAFYNLSFIWVEAGEMSFTLSNNAEDSAYYDITAIGNSLAKYDWVYKIRDTFVSVVDAESLQPLKFLRRTNEGDYWVKNDYTFNWKDEKIYTLTENAKKPRTRDTLCLDEGVFDLMSAIYYARCVDYAAMKVGGKVPVSTVVDNELFTISVEYLGLEAVRNKIDGIELECIKLGVTMVAGTIFNEGETIYAWVSNDANRLPIQVEAKILVGSVKAYLRKATNILLPHNSVSKKN